MTDTPMKREKASDLVEAPSRGDGPAQSAPSEPPTEKPSKPKATPRKRQPRRKPAAKKAEGDGQAPVTKEKEEPKAPAPKKKTTAKAPAKKANATSARSTKTLEQKSSRQRRKPSRRRTEPAAPAAERVMLVHNDPRGIQVAVLEEDEIVEHYVTRPEDRSIAGTVYLGQVPPVLPGREASFIDFGEGRNGVLYAGEVGIAGEEGEEIPRIETVLRSGQPILVQVTKDPMKAKGARLTALVSIAGRHLVLVPEQKSLGVSRRLPDKERNRLRDIAQEIRPKEHGLIIRTAAEGASRRDLERDLERVLETWAEIERKKKTAKAPALLYEEPELELRVIRDLFNREVQECIVDDANLEAKLRSYVRATTPDLDHRLSLYEGRLPIFEEFRVAEQIRKSLDRRVWLPAGGHIVVDRTEAMTVIDVNTGKFVGKSNLEETVFRANKEAAIEVARQLRLRDIGGIIVIDFIDMEDARNREELMKVFRGELARDRTRTQVFDITPLGLVQMTRKNVSQGIVEAFSDPCPTCEGRGILIHDLD